MPKLPINHTIIYYAPHGLRLEKFAVMCEHPVHADYYIVQNYANGAYSVKSYNALCRLTTSRLEALQEQKALLEKTVERVAGEIKEENEE